MASSITKRPRKGNKRLTDIREQEPAFLPRRSPRLSEKSGRGLPRPGHGGYPLLVASRRSIRPDTNVLDESGQSVPSMFDDDTTLDTTATTEMSIQHDHTYSSPHHSYLPGRDFVLSEVVPPSTSSPNRLYGLDVSDDEDQYMLAPDKGGESSREYNRHYKERTLTPRKQADAPGSSFISSLLSLFIRFVYRIGSVFYLLSNTVFCFDVTLLHKLGELFNGCNGKRRWCGFILLVAAFFVIALCLIVPHLPSAPPPPPPSAPPPPPPPPLVKTTTSYSTVTTTVVPSPSSPPSPPPPPPPPSLTDDEVLEIKSQIKMLQLKLDALSSKNDKDVKLLTDSINSITINKELTDLGVEIDGKLETMKDDERRKTHEMLRLLEEKIVKLSSTLKASTTEGKEAIDRLTLEVHKKPAGDGLSVAHVKEIAQDIVDVRYKEIMKLIEANEQSSEIDKIKDQLKVLPALKAQFAKLEINVGTLSSEVDSKLSELSSDLKSVKAAEILGKDDMKKIKVELEGLSDSFKLLESLVKSQANQQTVTVTATPSSSPTLTKASEDLVVDTIRKELLKYSADQVGRFDFALENAGGQIAASSETYDMSSSRVKLLGLTLPIRVSRLHPTAVIQADVLPGDCWCFGGESGFIVVKLSHNVIIDSVTVQHIPKALWADGTASSAPKEFKVFGQDSGTEENSVLLGSFTYDLDSTPIQTYPIVKQSDAFRFVKFQFETNYGNPSYTCIYRIRVHGSVKK